MTESYAQVLPRRLKRFTVGAQGDDGYYYHAVARDELAWLWFDSPLKDIYFVGLKTGRAGFALSGLMAGHDWRRMISAWFS